uniref:Zinc metalloproteinase n=1 Tax=Haemonchus contortus TaxID=6289 RepID=A0A7I4Y0W3_HAECO
MYRASRAPADCTVSRQGRIETSLPPARASRSTGRQKVSNLEHDSIDPSGDSVDEINEKSKIDRELFQSDIVLDKEQAWIIITDIEEESRGLDRTKRQALRDPSGLKYWTNGVNYTFNETLSAKARKAFIEGARLWSKDTCVKFRYDPQAKDRLIVQAKDGCWSYVGKSGGLQQTSLGKGLSNTFAVECHLCLKTSINSASINRSQPALVPFDIDYQKTLGSPFISFTDISMLNELYGCKKWCDGKAIVKCENGGYPHPRFCWKCVCPGGYAGRRCTERPDEGCGKTIEASKNWKTLSNVLGNRTVRRVLEKYNKCNYWIQSPEGTEIEVKLKYFSKKFAVDGCPYAGVEIKTNENQQLTGYRFCSPDAAGTKLRSHTNRVPIIIWNKIYLSKTILRYRYVPAEKPRPTTIRPTTHMTTWPATRRRVTSTAAPSGEEQVQRSSQVTDF